MKLEIHTLKALTDNYIYLLVAPDRRCAVVDPGEATPVLEFLAQRQLQLSLILCTHHHLDHVGGVAQLIRAQPCPVWTSIYDRQRIAHASVAVGEGESLAVFGAALQVLTLPGHTLGQIAYYLPDQEALFVGDTLFSCGCGRLFEGSAAQMFTSLKTIVALPPTTKIYFGHEYTLRNLEFLVARGVTSPRIDEYRTRCQKLRARDEPTTPTTLALELQINPFLMADSVADFRRWREARNAW